MYSLQFIYWHCLYFILNISTLKVNKFVWWTMQKTLLRKIIRIIINIIIN